MSWYHVDWKGYFPTTTAEKRPEARSYGVYAMYQVSGKKLIKLLYFGETYYQTFAQRLKQHRRDWLEANDRFKGTKTVIAFGSVILPRGRKISELIIREIESLHIQKCDPPKNTSSRRGYRGRDIIVINTGKVGLLDKVVCDDEELLALLRKHI